MEGIVAVPTMVSVVGFEPGRPTLTVSPTFLWSWANVTVPSTTWSVPAKACPERRGGPTAAFGLPPMTGTLSPSIGRVEKYTPVQPAT
jgi:hypothetical protein